MHLSTLKRQSMELGREDWTGDACGSGWQKRFKDLEMEETTQRVNVDRKEQTSNSPVALDSWTSIRDLLPPGDDTEEAWKENSGFPGSSPVNCLSTLNS